jgi:hypothetical protein
MCVRKVTSTGRTRYRGKQILVGQGFRGYEVGIEQCEDPKLVRVHFHELDLGTFTLPV